MNDIYLLGVAALLFAIIFKLAFHYFVLKD